MKLSHINARIHSTESGGAVDGPGIRYVVFMQGCPLRCKYCHNPDTWDVNSGKPINIKDLLHDIMKYKAFMKFSGGGVTVSGGEPLLCKDFLKHLFELLKDQGIHTAIDTSGYVVVDDELDAVLKNTGLVLLDVKHVDSDKHLELTGVRNIKTVEFLKHLQEKGIRTWVRWVVLTDFNDTIEYAHKFANFVKQFDNVELVELLPYHNMGQYKWEKLGFKYPLEGVAEPTVGKIKELAEVLHSYGVKTLGDL